MPTVPQVLDDTDRPHSAIELLLHAEAGWLALVELSIDPAGVAGDHTEAADLARRVADLFARAGEIDPSPQWTARAELAHRAASQWELTAHWGF